jgi:hypothetical protein
MTFFFNVFSDNFDFRVGYRILEGGGGNAKVNNFALFHYVSVGLAYTLRPVYSQKI